MSEPRDEGRTLSSGAEVWSFPSQYPELRSTREFYYAFMDCLCVNGRDSLKDPNTGTIYWGQCQSCWKRHWEHPATQAEHKRQLEELERTS